METWDYVKKCRHDKHSKDRSVVRCPVCKLSAFAVQKHVLEEKSRSKAIKETSYVKKVISRSKMLEAWGRQQASYSSDFMLGYVAEVCLSDACIAAMMHTSTNLNPLYTIPVGSRGSAGQSTLATYHQILTNSGFPNYYKENSLQIADLRSRLARKQRVQEVGEYAAIYLQARVRQLIAYRQTRRNILLRFELVQGFAGRSDFFVDKETRKKFSRNPLRYPLFMHGERPSSPRTIGRRLRSEEKRRKINYDNYLRNLGKGYEIIDEESDSYCRVLQQLAVLRDVVCIGMQSLTNVYGPPESVNAPDTAETGKGDAGAAGFDGFAGFDTSGFNRNEVDTPKLDGIAAGAASPRRQSAERETDSGDATSVATSRRTSRLSGVSAASGVSGTKSGSRGGSKGARTVSAQSRASVDRSGLDTRGAVRAQSGNQVTKLRSVWVSMTAPASSIRKVLMNIVLETMKRPDTPPPERNRPGSKSSRPKSGKVKTPPSSSKFSIKASMQMMVKHSGAGAEDMRRKDDDDDVFDLGPEEAAASVTQTDRSLVSIKGGVLSVRRDDGAVGAQGEVKAGTGSKRKGGIPSQTSPRRTARGSAKGGNESNAAFLQTERSGASSINGSEASQSQSQSPRPGQTGGRSVKNSPRRTGRDRDSPRRNPGAKKSVSTNSSVVSVVMDAMSQKDGGDEGEGAVGDAAMLSRPASQGGRQRTSISNTVINDRLQRLELCMWDKMKCDTPEAVVDLLTAVDFLEGAQTAVSVANSETSVWRGGVEVKDPKMIDDKAEFMPLSCRTHSHSERMDTDKAEGMTTAGKTGDDSSPTDAALGHLGTEVDVLVRSAKNGQVLPVSIQLRVFHEDRHPSGLFRLFFLDGEMIAVTQVSRWVHWPEVRKYRDNFMTQAKNFAALPQVKNFVRMYMKKASSAASKVGIGKKTAGIDFTVGSSSPKSTARAQSRHGKGDIKSDSSSVLRGTSASGGLRVSMSAYKKPSKDSANLDDKAGGCIDLFVPPQNLLFVSHNRGLLQAAGMSTYNRMHKFETGFAAVSHNNSLKSADSLALVPSSANESGMIPFEGAHASTRTTPRESSNNALVLANQDSYSRMSSEAPSQRPSGASSSEHVGAKGTGMNASSLSPEEVLELNERHSFLRKVPHWHEILRKAQRALRKNGSGVGNSHGVQSSGGMLQIEDGQTNPSPAKLATEVLDGGAADASPRALQNLSPRELPPMNQQTRAQTDTMNHSLEPKEDSIVATVRDFELLGSAIRPFFKQQAAEYIAELHELMNYEPVIEREDAHLFRSKPLPKTPIQVLSSALAAAVSYRDSLYALSTGVDTALSLRTRTIPQVFNEVVLDKLGINPVTMQAKEPPQYPNRDVAVAALKLSGMSAAGDEKTGKRLSQGPPRTTGPRLSQANSNSASASGRNSIANSASQSRRTSGMVPGSDALTRPLSQAETHAQLIKRAMVTPIMNMVVLDVYIENPNMAKFKKQKESMMHSRGGVSGGMESSRPATEIGKGTTPQRVGGKRERVGASSGGASHPQSAAEEPKKEKLKPAAQIHQLVGAYAAEPGKPPKGLDLGLFEWDYFERILAKAAGEDGAGEDGTAAGAGAGPTAAVADARRPVAGKENIVEASGERLWSASDEATGLARCKMLQEGGVECQCRILDRPPSREHYEAVMPMRVKQWVGMI